MERGLESMGPDEAPKQAVPVPNVANMKNTKEKCFNRN